MTGCDDPKVSISIKRGDDFKLDLTVEDPNNTVAITALEALNAAKAADPVDPAAVASAQAAYDAAIIVDITGWTIQSEVRRKNELIDTLDVVILDATAGTFSISKGNAFTANWPTKLLDCDIQFTRSAGRISSETFEIDVLRDVTA